MKKKWLPIEVFMEITSVTKDEIYNRIKSGEWHNGFVIKKAPATRAKNEKYRREGKIIRWGCVEDFEI